MRVLSVHKVQNPVCHEFIPVSTQVFRIQRFQLRLTLVELRPVTLNNKKKKKGTIKLNNHYMHYEHEIL